MMFILDSLISWTLPTVLQQLVHWQSSQNTPARPQWRMMTGRVAEQAYEHSGFRKVAAHQPIIE